MDDLQIQEAVQEALDQINRNVINNFIENRKRSGSTPNYPTSSKIKESDLSSITTMGGTQHTHSSTRKIEQVFASDEKTRINREDNMREISAWRRKDLNKWVLRKNDRISCPNMDISAIKYYFIKIAHEEKMTVMRDLENIVTVKSCSNQSIGCFFRYCLPIGWDRSVYQLERSINPQGSRIKINLVSGNEYEFENFKNKLYYQLWENGVLELQKNEAIRLTCTVNKQFAKTAKKIYQKAYSECEIKNLDTIEEVEKWEIGLMTIFKQCEEKMYNCVFENQLKIPKTPDNIDFLSQHLLTMIPIQEFYIKSKIQESKKIIQIRKQVQNDLTIGQIFHYLEVEQRFSPFIKFVSHKSIAILLAEQQQLPFHKSLQSLEALNFGVSPMRNLQLISQFTKTLLETYKKLCECEDPMLDMDSQLPLTIYCVLGCMNPQLKPLVSLLMVYLENEDSFENEKRTLAALNASLDFVRSEWNSKRQGNQ